MNPVLEAKNLSKKFQRDQEIIQLFETLDFSVFPSETIAITGPSGCGKSTLLFLLAGLDNPDQGSVFWQGQSVTTLGESRKSRLRGTTIGFVFQFHHLLPEFSAAENVMMPGLIQGKSMDEAMAEARPLMERMDVWKRASHRPSELSGGEQQRVSFARALVNRPLVVLADEPTGNLDEKNADIMLSLMHSVVSEIGVSFVLVTHDSKVAGSCSKRFHLSGGRLAQLQ